MRKAQFGRSKRLYQATATYQVTSSYVVALLTAQKQIFPVFSGSWLHRLQGASGAIFAIFACSALLHPHHVYLWFTLELTAPQLILATVMLDAMASAGGGNVDVAGHIGGAAFGAAYAKYILR